MLSGRIDMSKELSLDDILNSMWQDYVSLIPQAQMISDLFRQRGDSIVNDHIALRTYNIDPLGINQLAKSFLTRGYKEAGEYKFENKKLVAKHYQHPDDTYPKIFISELETEKLSAKAQTLIRELVEQLDQSSLENPLFTTSGRAWNLSSEVYDQLRDESEYAAWVAAFGHRPNHFTVYVNKLKSLSTIEELNTFLKNSGFELNSSGGEIKGSPEVYLEQSSTLADSIKVKFSDTEKYIPSCYFEFAKRYAMPDGQLYQGFVAGSADKIFESTDKGQSAAN